MAQSGVSGPCWIIFPSDLIILLAGHVALSVAEFTRLSYAESEKDSNILTILQPIRFTSCWSILMWCEPSLLYTVKYFYRDICMIQLLFAFFNQSPACKLHLACLFHTVLFFTSGVLIKSCQVSADHITMETRNPGERHKVKLAPPLPILYLDSAKLQYRP